ncbi:glycoside hydrolase family 31 protein [Balneatrix alpica]|uniref:glycoside hydrolase family 31 protein n=1 Tax=Balneatrix alpica TaxID=75684 RepID=UPI0027399F95|nr:TIM-barrel domain-containing protein [Balneatrix alpica]
MDFTRFERLQGLTLLAHQGHCLDFDCDGQPLRVEAWRNGMVRLRLGHDQRADYGLLMSQPEVAEVTLQPLAQGYCLRWGQSELRLESHPFRLSWWFAGRCLLTSVTDEHFRGWPRLPNLGRDEQAGQSMLALALESETPVYGLGEKFGALNKRGQLITCYVEDALGVNTELAYKNIPFAWSPEGWGLFVHTSATVQHGVGYGPWSHRSYGLLVDEPVLDVFLFAGAQPLQLLQHYTWLTGTAPTVPLWSLGVWVSRAYYRTEEEIMEAAQELRQRRFPVDVITFDGRAWQDTPTRYNFEWDPSRYPDPARVVGQLKALDFRVCCWEYPLVSVNNRDFAEMEAKGWFLKNQQGETYRYAWDTSAKTSPFGKVLTPLPVSGILDFTHPEAYAYWRDKHQELFDVGVDVMKVDFGEQVPMDAVAYNGDSGRQLHNVYPLLYNRSVYEASAERYGDQACVWARASWTGSQRYPLQWGGDPQSDWEGLAASIRGGLSWGMSGAPYHATDVGGFYGQEQPSGELYLRWVQAGIFASHFRIHGIGPREPWAFGEQIEALARQQFEFRYRLLPYLMGCVEQAAASGIPVMRAMALAFPDDRLARGFETQFMCGPSLLVAPVIRADGWVEVWLPEGEWYHLWTGERYQGQQLLRLQAPLAQIPVFGRAGYALPLGPVVQHSGEIKAEALVNELWCFGEVSEPVCVWQQAIRLQDGQWQAEQQDLSQISLRQFGG